MLIATGLLMFGFVAYQLWGTGIETARAQNQLESEFDAKLAEAPPVVAPDVVPEDGTSADSATPPSTAVETDQPDAAEPADDECALQPAEPVETLPRVPVERQNIPSWRTAMRSLDSRFRALVATTSSWPACRPAI
ncbi:hypothetical protein [uncultured Ilumatobacter sp.]|uniref:hypothetical protein n=1 Tax=uncultured Ilumatobacter sp. TaxID=879968 RepID=UPI00374E7A09